MSVTNLDLIQDALRSINVINEVQTPSAEQGSHCLRELNQMLAQWAEDDVPLGYFEQSNTTATCPIPQWAEKGVKYKLAIQVAPAYSAEVPIAVVANADDGYMTILRRVITLQMDAQDMSHMPVGSGSFGNGFDITNG